MRLALICLPHLRLALATLGSSARQQLVTHQQQMWQALISELEEAIRKQGARFRHETWGTKRTPGAALLK